MKAKDDLAAEFIVAACAPRDRGHASGDLKRAEEILAAHPKVAMSSIYTAAILGDEKKVRAFIKKDPASATAKGGPYDWDALTHLCFSRYLRLDKSRSAGFVAAARALLDAGTDANTGWFEKDHQPEPGFESVLYGAAGVAHHAELTWLLVERGADVNDGEVYYHSPEGWDNGAMIAIVESGRLNKESLAFMLLRKHDWHDLEGIRYLLEHGADPNHVVGFGSTSLYHGVLRDNSKEIIELSLKHGGDPTVVVKRRSPSGEGEVKETAMMLAARRGRKDLLELFDARGFHVQFAMDQGLIVSCAVDNAANVRGIAQAHPKAVEKVLANGGKLLCDFAGNGNVGGVARLLDLGVPVDAVYEEGDGYFGIAKKSRALHVAAWRMRPAVVKLLIERGAKVDAKDGDGRTALMLAAKACVDSYWSERKSPEGVRMLLDAGAMVEGVKWPCGYGEVDELLQARGAR